MNAKLKALEGQVVQVGYGPSTGIWREGTLEDCKLYWRVIGSDGKQCAQFGRAEIFEVEGNQITIY